VGEADSEAILLKNIEMLFDVHFKQDPLCLLQRLPRNKTVVAAWDVPTVDDHMTYAISDHPEHRRYPIRGFVVASREVAT